MKRYILMFEYDSKKFMDVNKVIVFKRNLEKIEEKGNYLNIVFYGEASNEEFATFMSYFNNLVEEKICHLSISFKTKELVIENGINNKSIKLSAKNAREIRNKRFDNVINEYYGKEGENIEIKILPAKDWESIILDLIGE